MEPAKVFPIYQLQDAFEAFCHGEPAVKPQHRSLYYFLIGYCRRRGNTPKFNLTYEAGMHGSAIGSWATYDAALKALAGWGFIHYTPGANRYKVPVIELTFRNPSDDVLLTYWQSYLLSTSNPSDNPSGDVLVTLKEELKKVSEELAKLKSGEGAAQAKTPPPPVFESLPIPLPESLSLDETPPAPPVPAAPPKATRTMPADEAPIFQRVAFNEYLDSEPIVEVFGRLNKGYYWIAISKAAEDARPKERTNDGWQKFIFTFLTNDMTATPTKLVLATIAKGEQQPMDLRRPKNMQVYR